MRPFELVLEREETLGDPGAFLVIRRLRLRNRWADGSMSKPYVCEFAHRPRGTDAVIVVLWRAQGGRVSVLLRRGLRPALSFGRRDPEAVPVPDAEPRLWLTEVVAGVIERGDRGEAGIRQRAALEAWEEAGVRIVPEQFEFLGAPTFPTPGSMAEQYWILAAALPDNAPQEPPPGDGSPMEQGATTTWCDLDQAIDDCVAGVIADGKTELALRRLRDRITDARGPQVAEGARLQSILQARRSKLRRHATPATQP